MTKVVEAVDARQASGPDKIIEDTAGAPVRQALAALIQRFGDTP